MSDPTLNILRVVQNESFGDHGETTTRAVQADPSMTLGQLADLYLVQWQYDGSPEPFDDAYLVIRVPMLMPRLPKAVDPSLPPF